MTVTIPQLREAGPKATGGMIWRLQDVWSLTRRNLVHISREPMQLSDVTIQPVLFTLLFIFVFGSGIPIAGGTYKEFALAGLLTLNLTTSVMGTAVGLSTDLHEGVIDRFRTLPMWRASILVGRSIADVMSATLCVTIVALTGLAIGWRPDATIPSVIGGFALALFFISNSLVPTQHMPGWLQVIAEWNPVSAVTAGARTLFGNPNPSSTINVWPMQHPVDAALLWSVAILAVGAPLASYLFKRRTTE